MCDQPSLDVRFYFDISRKAGDTTADAELVRRFVPRFRTTQWPTGRRLPCLYYDPRALVHDPNQRAVLHAKCVVVDDREVFVSSANFTEAAQRRNVELGVLLKSPEVANRIKNFFEQLSAAGRFIRCS